MRIVIRIAREPYEFEYNSFFI